MNFYSDNAAPVAEGVMSALVNANNGYASSYGEDEISRDLHTMMESAFGHRLKVFAVASGTAANALGLAAVTPPFGAILCHESSHLQLDEAGAPEFFTHGAKLIPIQGRHGKLTPRAVAQALAAFVPPSVHRVRPAALSVTQPTEWGVCYSINELRALGDCARKHGLLLHMDGARLGNAIAHLGCATSDISWKAGVDILSFGGTKAGARAAEAIVLFNDWNVETLAIARKRSGHLLSKSRYMAVELCALLKDDYWLQLCAHANAMARRLADAIAPIEDVEIVAPVQANLVFLRLPNRQFIEFLREGGATFQIVSQQRKPVIRLAASFATTTTEVKEMVALITMACSKMGEKARTSSMEMGR